MVAITVAIAATVYVYVSGMLSGGPSKAPDISFVQNDINVPKTLTVTKVSANNIPWSDLTVTGPATLWTGGMVLAGQTINITGAGTVAVSYKGTTLYGSWVFT